MAKQEAELMPRRVKILIHKDPRPGAVDPVFVGVNNVGYTINRGQAAEVPVEVVEVLENAKETHYDVVQNQDGSQAMIPREAYAYPFAIVG